MPQAFDPDQFIADTAPQPQPAAAPAFDPDAFLAQTQASSSPAKPTDQDDLMPFLEREVPAIGGMVKNAAIGAGNALMHPLDTAQNIANSVADTSPEDIARIGRKIPIVGPAIDWLNKQSEGMPGPLGLPPGYSKITEAQDAQHAQQHPLTDFLQGVPGLAALPAGHLAQAGALAVDAFQRSLAQGDDTLTAMKKARNAGILTSLMLKTGDAVSAAPGVIGRYAAKEAGVQPETISRYLANPETMTAAGKIPDEGFKDLVDQRIAPINQAAEDAQNMVEASKGAVQDTKEIPPDLAMEVPQSLAPDLEARQQALDQAQRGVETAQENVANTKLPPQDIAEEIPAHLDTQGEKLHGLSMQAFDTLSDEGHTFPEDQLTGAIDKQMEGLKIAGVVPSLGPDAAAYAALGKFKGMVTKIGDKLSGGIETPEIADPDAIGNTKSLPEASERPPADIPAPIVKKLIQQLDGVSKESYSTNAGALSPAAAGNLAQVRYSFDQAVKEASPAYAEQMAQLAPQVRLVNDMSKIFGNEQMAMGALKAASDPMTPRGAFVRQKLAEYDAQNGTNFAQRVSDYSDIPKAILKANQDLLENLKQTQGGQLLTNEMQKSFGSDQKVLQALRAARDPQSPIGQTMRNLLAQYDQAKGTNFSQRVSQYYDTPQANLSAAQQNLQYAKEAASKVNKLGPNSTQSVLPSIGKGKNIEAARQLEGVDPQLLQMAKDREMMKQFQRPTTNGSRKAVMGRGIGGAAGAAAGGFMAGPTGAVVGGFLGQAAGGFAGGLADLYGGQAVKMALDAGIKIDHLTPKLAKTVLSAAQGGPKALAITHYMLNQTDPAYQKANNPNGVQ